MLRTSCLCRQEADYHLVSTVHLSPSICLINTGYGSATDFNFRSWLFSCLMLLAPKSLIFLPDMIYLTVSFFLQRKETQTNLEVSNYWHLTHELFPCPVSYISHYFQSDWSHMLSPFISWPFPAGKALGSVNIWKPHEFWKGRLGKILFTYSTCCTMELWLIIFLVDSTGQCKNFILLPTDMIKVYDMELLVGKTHLTVMSHHFHYIMDIFWVLSW